MALYKPSELHQFLSELGVQPKKGMSQNFLIDGNIIRKLIERAEVKPGDVVVEIGPGPGALTEALLDSGAHVIAVEKDPLLAEALKRLDKGRGLLTVYCEDILTFPLQETILPFLNQCGKSRAKVIGNLPYHITTPILVELIPKRDLFESVFVMVQEEVARRFTAKPGNKIYGSITLFLNFYSIPTYQFLVSKQCFYPIPKVESAIVSFRLIDPPAVIENETAFFTLTRTAFHQRRKMLRSSLSGLYPTAQLLQAMEQCRINPTARPEDLSIEEFIALYLALQKSSSE